MLRVVFRCKGEGDVEGEGVGRARKRVGRQAGEREPRTRRVPWLTNVNWAEENLAWNIFSEICV